LQRLVGDQQKTVAELQELIRELSPEAGKAADLEAAVASIQRANQELTGCVAVLEDENAMLRSELESVNAQLDRQDAMREEASLEITQELKTADEERRQLEIKVQELGALVEFKDAAIEELEKQYRTLESRYAALSERK
jgi:chromosome segregation ATPase